MKEENTMEKRNLSELSLEELVKVAGGTIEPINERSMDLWIRLFKQQGRKMEEVYQIPDLPDEQREYIRRRWYEV